MTIDISRVKFGRLQSKPDARDFRLANYIPSGAVDLTGEKIWNYPYPPMNQKLTPHCTGFGFCGWGNNEPVIDNFTDQDAHDVYYKLKEIDGEPGAEDGSTVRTVGMYGVQSGRMPHYAFAATMNDLLYWLIYKGPLIVGTNWTTDMMTTDKDNFIHPTGGIAGGHCYGINAKYAEPHLRIQNSWGLDFGINGQAFISFDDFEKLFHDGGEVLAAVENTIPTIQSSGCVAAALKSLHLA